MTDLSTKTGLLCQGHDVQHSTDNQLRLGATDEIQPFVCISLKEALAAATLFFCSSKRQNPIQTSTEKVGRGKCCAMSTD